MSFMIGMLIDAGFSQRRVSAALPSGGRIYLHESLLNETRDGPPLMTLYSMNMARVTDYGKQYSASELAEILLEAGFTNFRITPTYSIFSLISATRPSILVHESCRTTLRYRTAGLVLRSSSTR